MIEYILEVLRAIVFGFGHEGIELASPLVAGGIALGSQILGQGVSRLIGRGERRKTRRREREARNRLDSSMAGLDASVGAIEEQADLATTLASAGFEPTYGAERDAETQRVTDQIQAGSATGQRSISRSLMASGGDVTGSGATMYQNMQEGANRTLAEALANIRDSFSRRYDQRVFFDRRRADDLLRTASSARMGQARLSAGLHTEAEDRRLEERQARMQLGADIGDEIADFGAVLL